MKQVQRFVTIALALLLIGVPAVSLAQTPSSPAAGSSDKAKDKPADKPAAPSASPSTGSSDTGAKTDSGSGAGQASPMAPASAEDCKKDGWQKLGFKTEAECTAKVKK